MKPKLILGLGVLACAGLVAAFAVAPSTGADTGTTTDSTTSSTTSTSTTGHGKKGEKGKRGEHGPKGKLAKANACQHVDLRGANGSGSVTFTVVKAGHASTALVGQQVTLTIPAGSALKAKACADAAGTLTLRDLKVEKAPPAPPQP